MRRVCLSSAVRVIFCSLLSIRGWRGIYGDPVGAQWGKDRFVPHCAPEVWRGLVLPLSCLSQAGR